MTVRSLSWGSGTGTSWSRRVAVLVTAAATALGLAVVVSPAADAAKPVPTFVGDLRITVALDADTDQPTAAPDKDAVGFVIPNEDYTIVVETRQVGSAVIPYDVERDSDITISDGTRSYTATIQAGQHTATVTGAQWPSTHNFSLQATSSKQAALAPDSIPVTVAVKSSNPRDVAPGQLLKLTGCTQDDPTCVSLTVNGLTGVSEALLSTSECANFLPGVAVKKVDETTSLPFSCRSGKKGAEALVAQTFVTLVEGQVATVVLDCDKLICANGGVGSFVPWVDKGNSGVFEQPDPCPSRGELGAGQGVCVDYRQSSRDNAGDLHTYILFDKDARMIH